MKRIVTIILLLSLPYIVGCAQSISKQPIKQDTIMQLQRAIERYDFEATKNGTKGVVIEQNGWIIGKSKMINKIKAIYNEYAPAKDFYDIQKIFYSNGIMRTKTSYLGNVAIGIYEEYDEAGNLIKVVDEDKKFGKIKPQDIVEFLEKEGWFNRETGENKIAEKKVLPTTGAFYREITRYMWIRYTPQERSRTGRSYWVVSIEPHLKGYKAIYIIDGETGEFTKEEEGVVRYL